LPLLGLNDQPIGVVSVAQDWQGVQEINRGRYDTSRSVIEQRARRLQVADIDRATLGNEREGTR
jgi:hypothetical protein